MNNPFPIKNLVLALVPLSHYKPIHTCTQNSIYYPTHTPHTYSARILIGYLLHEAEISLSFHTMPNNLFLLTIEPLFFTFCFSIEWYNVFATMEFFPHIDVVMVESTLDPFGQDTQGLPEVNTFLNLFNNWSLDRKFIFTLSLKNFTFLHCYNKTTNLLINHYEVFYWALLLFLLRCNLYFSLG